MSPHCLLCIVRARGYEPARTGEPRAKDHTIRIQEHGPQGGTASAQPPGDQCRAPHVDLTRDDGFERGGGVCDDSRPPANQRKHLENHAEVTQQGQDQARACGA